MGGAGRRLIAGQSGFIETCGENVKSFCLARLFSITSHVLVLRKFTATRIIIIRKRSLSLRPILFLLLQLPRTIVAKTNSSEKSFSPLSHRALPHWLCTVAEIVCKHGQTFRFNNIVLSVLTNDAFQICKQRDER